MIDRVNLYKNVKLDTSKFSLKLKKNYNEYIDFKTGEVIEYISSYILAWNGVRFLYAVNSERIYVTGRLVMLLKQGNHVHNIDDLYSYREEIRQKINNKLKELFNIELDILEFTVASMEVTFNIYNVNADLYLRLFNQIIKDKADNRYINYVDRNNIDTNTSVYIKSKHNYKSNINKTYTINFYNKLEQLKTLKSKVDMYKSSININQLDLALATNTLRLEVKCAGYELKKYGRTFKTYFDDIYICRDIVLTKYKRFI
ncbi:phage/plasmid replication protein, partial [Clostridioides sp. ES-S-0049-03]|nr:hypothetical protein [Clostridioides sp. ES-S-0049-03]